MIISPQYLNPLQESLRLGVQGPRRSRSHSPTALLKSVRRGAQGRTAKPSRHPASSITRSAHQVCASWSTEQADCELVVLAHATGLQLKFCTWLKVGPALEQSFAVHTLAEFEGWMTIAPTKFGHPVAHEEIRRFAHANLTR